MVYTECGYICSVVGPLFTKTYQNITKRCFSKKDCPSTFSYTCFSSICENIPHLEYSGGQSFTLLRIHDITSDGELERHAV